MDTKQKTSGNGKETPAEVLAGKKITKANIGISDKNLEAVALILNTVLADEFLLYTKTRNYHWNVTGIHFRDLHKFFEIQYTELEELIDEIAERVRYLGHYAIGTLNEFSQLTRLLESKEKDLNAEQMLRNLLDDHETIIRELRADIAKTDEHKDAGTTDFLTGLMEKHEKTAWMIRSHLS